MIRHLSMPIVLCLLGAQLTATAAEQRGPGAKDWRWTLQAGAVYQAESSLDSGGDMSAARFFVSGGGAKVLRDRWRLGATLGYGEDDYDFSGSSGFGGLDPWDRVREFRAGVSAQYFANDEWTLYAIPSVRFNAESGASFDDGINGGLLAGASYRVSDTLTIGPGFGVFTEIEDSTSFFPILLIDWKITDTLSLETGRGFAASRGPGLQLRWRYSPTWQFAIGGRYEKTRFRLDDEGVAPGGVGQDKAIPLFALAEYAMGQDLKLGLIGGAEVGGELRLEDDAGKLIGRSDLSEAMFLGATFQASF
jgi:outer membrane receptor protein involved in Fe transport